MPVMRGPTLTGAAVEATPKPSEPLAALAVLVPPANGTRDNAEPATWRRDRRELLWDSNDLRPGEPAPAQRVLLPAVPGLARDSHDPMISSRWRVRLLAAG